jgi:hypothetical protein
MPGTKQAASECVSVGGRRVTTIGRVLNLKLGVQPVGCALGLATAIGKHKRRIVL